MSDDTQDQVKTPAEDAAEQTALKLAEQRAQDPAPISSSELKTLLDAVVSEMKGEIAALTEKVSKAPVVPPTDTKPAAVTTPVPDFSTLSPIAKIASGYNK